MTSADSRRPSPAPVRTLWPSRPASSTARSLSADPSPRNRPSRHGQSSSCSQPRRPHASDDGFQQGVLHGDGAPLSHAPTVSADAAPASAAPTTSMVEPGSPDAIAAPPAVLLDVIPERLKTLPGLSERQRTGYSKWATLYLRQLSWQDRTPSPEAIQAFLRRLKEGEVHESQRLMAQEALMFVHDVLLRIPSTGPTAPSSTDEVTSDELPSAVQHSVIAQLSGPSRLMARLAFSTGMKPSEVAHIRTGDVTLSPDDGDGGSIVVRDEHGRCDRIVEVDEEIADALRVQLMRARSQYDRDREANFAGAPLPSQIEAIFPKAGNGWEWQFVFPSERREADPATGGEVRPCMGASHLIATIDAILSTETHILWLEV